MKVLLLPEEKARCKGAALTRVRENKKRRATVTDRRMDPFRSDFQMEYSSICAEAAVAKAYDGKAGALENPLDISAPDVVTGQGEVFEVKYTHHQSGKLLLQAWNIRKLRRDPPDWLILVTPSDLGGYHLRFRVRPHLFLMNCKEFRIGSKPPGRAMSQSELATFGEIL
jgi:hypothetical protein